MRHLTSATNIAKEEFKDCKSLTSITLPSNVSSIGENAFYYCSELKSVVIGKNIKNVEKMLLVIA